MRVMILALFLILNSGAAFSQNSLKKDLLALQDFMDTHIPIMNGGISHFKLSVKRNLLIIKTVLHEGESYIKKFDIKDGQVKLKKIELSEEEQEAYGYPEFWEVSIGREFVLSSMEVKSEAEKLIELINAVQNHFK